ncbi:AraC family transcriptional regulator [Marinilabiliaceae bacterium JC017]|nr:AraC family transcriptional regulator [Marinilabiliaceae bacterium JC017]
MIQPNFILQNPNSIPMSNTTPIHLQFQEGNAQQYMQTLLQQFGGTQTDNSYLLETGPVRIKFTTYSLPDGVEMTISEMETKKKVITDRTPDSDPDYIHINIIKEGKYTQFFKDQSVHVDAESSKGVFIYDGQFPILVEFSPGVNVKWVGFKFKISQLTTLFGDAQKILKGLFDDMESVAYHTALPGELERLLNDLIHYQQLSFNQLPMITSRAIEIFSSLSATLQELKENHTITGLHITDYENLLKIKKRLLNIFSQKITIDGLAEEFGISASKLKRDFKQLFNMSIYKFHTHAKMDEAFRRLKSGNYSVAEVGYDMGYQNLSKFAEMFKKIKGISPKEVLKLSGASLI